MKGRTPTYAACVHGFVSDISTFKPLGLAHALTDKCLGQLRELDDPYQFGPRLLILFLSPLYSSKDKVRSLLQAIQERFAPPDRSSLPLIGCTVAEVVAEDDVSDRGAALICLASRTMQVRISGAILSMHDPRLTADGLLSKLDTTDHGDSGTQTALLTFFPGRGQHGDETTDCARYLHAEIAASLPARTLMFGGIASRGNLGDHGVPLVFKREATCDVDPKLVVCAQISGYAVGVGWMDGLEEVPNVHISVEEVGDDGCEVIRCQGYDGLKSYMDSGPRASERLVLLRDSSKPDMPLVILPERTGKGHILKLNRPVRAGSVLSCCVPDSHSLAFAAKLSGEKAVKSGHISRPIINLVFACDSRYGTDERKLHNEHAFLPSVAAVSEMVDAPCMGGLFDGEAGATDSGRPIMANWSVATAVLGDQVDERDFITRGLQEVAEHGGAMMRAHSLQDLMQEALYVLEHVGFPGGMLSFIFDKEDETRWIIGQHCFGSRYAKIVERTQRPLAGDDILALIAREGKPKFIPDSRDVRYHCDSRAVSDANLVSQYCVPLSGDEGQTIATLQIDLGDRASEVDLYPAEKEVIRALSDVVSAAFSRYAHGEEIRIDRELDQALSHSMSAESLQIALDQFIGDVLKALRVQQAYIRLLGQDKKSLLLVAGVGPYYERAKVIRPVILLKEQSPSTECFNSGRVRVSNDGKTDQALRYLIHRLGKESDAISLLHEFSAYAMIPIIGPNRATLGVLAVVAPSPWFFNISQIKALEDLGARIGVLIPAVLSRVGLQFLSELQESIPRDVIHDLTDPTQSLHHVLELCSRAIGGEVASLYLLQPAGVEYVLRASVDWSDPDCVGIVRYRRNQDWTGKAACQRNPIHVEDMQTYRKARGMKPAGRYAEAMFGEELARTISTEAIALPLWVAGANLGVATFHRFRRSSPPRSGFIVTDEGVLSRAADYIASLVNEILSSERRRQTERSRQRREDVIKSLIEVSGDKAMADVMCRTVLQKYEATEVVCYRTNPSGNSLDWNCGRTSRENTSVPITESLPADKVVKQVFENHLVHLSHMRKKSGEGGVSFHCRAIVPLLSRRFGRTSLWGILDIRWRNTRAEDTCLAGTETGLMVLGTELGGLLTQSELVAALTSSRDWNKSLAASLPFFLIRKDLQGRITYVNKRYLEEAGLSEDKVKDLRDIDLYPPEHATKYRKDDQEVIRQKKAKTYDEVHCLPGRQPMIVHVTKSPIFEFPEDPQGRVVGVQAIFTDVTNKVLIERELGAELIQWQDIVFRTLGHEVVAPMGDLSEDLRKKVESGIARDDPCQESWGTLIRRFARIHEIARNYWERGLGDGKERVSADPGEAIMEAKKLATAAGDRGRTPIDVTVSSDAPRVQADTTRLIQVLVNLLRNAVTALSGLRGPEHKGRVRVQVYVVRSDSRKAYRDVWLGKMGTDEVWIVFSILDNGPGIDPEIMKTVLEYPAGDRRRHLSLGMGLRIVRRIVAAYDGKFYIRTPCDAGTEVLFALKPFKELR